MQYFLKSLMFQFRSGVESITPLIESLQQDVLIGTCAFFLAYGIITIIKNARSNYPPGPIGLPIVGYLPFLSENLHLDFIELGKKYGDVFSVRLGSQNTVVLHGSDAIREALNKVEFLGKPPTSALELVNPISPFFGSNFQAWKEQRRFVVQSLKDLGLGKTKIEEDVMDEINHFMEVLRNCNSQPIDLNKPLSPSISNNICALVFGKRYEYDDPDRKLLDRSLDEANDSFSLIPLDILFPWLRNIPFFTKFLKGDKSVAGYKNIRRLLKMELDKHIQGWDSENFRDFIDRYLFEINFQNQNNTSTTFHHDMLMSSAIDIFAAGSETVRTSIIWNIYTMAAYPSVQKKIQKEIMDVLGPNRKPEFLDMKNMPYTHAVILELLRWKTVVPLNLVRYTLADTTVGGYDIPQGTHVMVNFWNAHHDTRYWSEPEKFQPERFLSKDGASVVKPRHYSPFSLGRRVCPGESMAYMEIFLYITSMLQKFDVVFPEEMKPTFDAKLTIMYRLEPFRVKFVPKT